MYELVKTLVEIHILFLPIAVQCISTYIVYCLKMLYCRGIVGHVILLSPLFLSASLVREGLLQYLAEVRLVLLLHM